MAGNLSNDFLWSVLAFCVKTNVGLKMYTNIFLACAMTGIYLCYMLLSTHMLERIYLQEKQTKEKIIIHSGSIFLTIRILVKRLSHHYSVCQTIAVLALQNTRFSLVIKKVNMRNAIFTWNAVFSQDVWLCFPDHSISCISDIFRQHCPKIKISVLC